MVRPDVAQIEEQQRCSYWDEGGRRRVHTFDFVVTKTNGERIAVAVKPSKVAAKKGWAAQLKVIAAGMSRSFADRVALMTEKSMDRVIEFNAQLFHAALRYPTQTFDAAVAKVVSELREPATIAQIAAATGFAGRAFWSVVRLIESGVLTVISHVRITHRTLVRLAVPDGASSQAFATGGSS